MTMMTRPRPGATPPDADPARDLVAVVDMIAELTAAGNGNAGLGVTFRRSALKQWTYKLDLRDPARPVVILDAGLSPAGVLEVLPRVMWRLRSELRDRTRPTLRALPGTADPTAPVRPTLRVIPGGGA